MPLSASAALRLGAWCRRVRRVWGFLDLRRVASSASVGVVVFRSRFLPLLVGAFGAAFSGRGCTGVVRRRRP